MLVDIAEQENPLRMRMSTDGATSAMLHERWFTYRHERTSSSSSDSGVAIQFSPPLHIRMFKLVFYFAFILLKDHSLPVI